MKKLFAIMLALMLVLTMGSALAEPYNAITNGGTFEITKTYGDTGYPGGETLTFTVTAVTADAPPVSINSNGTAEIAAGATSAILTVNLPEYTVPGVYEYTISEETDGAIAGVTYADDYNLKVTVYYDNNGDLVCQPALRLSDGDKTNQIVNTFATGSLSVEKLVKGQFGDKTKEFEVKVTFNAPANTTVKNDISYEENGETKKIEAGWTGSKEVVINLQHEETITFTDIPSGVTYSVVETDTDASVEGTATDYKVEYDSNASGTIGSEVVSTIITNTSTNTTPVDTGITTDNLPYIVLMGIVVLAGVAMIAKRRMAHND